MDLNVGHLGDQEHRPNVYPCLGWTASDPLIEAQPAWRLGLSIREYRELEAGARSPNFETWDRICEPYGWPQTFVGGGSRDA